MTYWDSSEWKDTFATEAFTERQWRYARYQHRDMVWTPQVYINGHTDIVGDNRATLDKVIQEAQSNGPAIAWPSPTRVEVKASTEHPPISDVWLVRYDPRTLHTRVASGENGGRTLDQRNVVRELVHLGQWQGDDAIFPLPPPSLSGLDAAVLVQVGNGGDILSQGIRCALRAYTCRNFKNGTYYIDRCWNENVITQSRPPHPRLIG